MNQADHEWLNNRIAAAVDDDFYLDRGEEQRIKEESAARGILARDCELILREELEARSSVSERVLIEQLDRLLHQFTDKDKKLDQKEERDALNKVLTPGPGKKVGLDPRVAEEYVATFCRVNGAARSTDRKWVGPALAAVGAAVVVVIALVAFAGRGQPTAARAAGVVQAEVAKSAPGVRLNDEDRAEIDDQLRRAAQYIDNAQYTEPPEKSAKASLDQIKQIDPNGEYRGTEVKQLASKIVEHYLDLADKSASTKDMAAAEKWLARAKLLSRDREVILEKERALGLVRSER